MQKVNVLGTEYTIKMDVPQEDMPLDVTDVWIIRLKKYGSQTLEKAIETVSRIWTLTGKKFCDTKLFMRFCTKAVYGTIVEM